METKESEKLCPFCEEFFPSDKIKSHIGLNHLGIILNKDESKNEVFVKNEDSKLNTKPKVGKRKKKNVFECEKCSKIVSSSKQLRKHMRIVHALERISCEFCGKSVAKLMFKNHQEKCKVVFEEKYSGLEYQCKSCKRSYATKDKLRNHKHHVHSNIRHKCEHCLQTFASKDHKKVHVQSRHQNVFIKCDVCQMSFNSKPAWKYHVSKLHSEVDANMMKPTEIVEQSPNELTPHEEGFCPDVKDDKKADLSESASKESIKKMRAKKKNRGLKSTEPTEITTNQKAFRCNKCSKTFTRKNVLKDHIKAVHNGVYRRCDLCSKYFNSYAGLWRHKQSIHTGSKVSCKMCLKYFTTKEGLDRHACKPQNDNKEHSPLKKLMPVIMLERLSQETIQKYTQNHQVQDESEINETFNLSLVLQVRESEESKEKKDFYQCLKCNKNFKQSCHLSQHDEIVHQKIRYGCDTCTKSFCTSWKLFDHLKKQHDIVIECQHCRKRFETKTKLNDHIKTAHPESSKMEKPTGPQEACGISMELCESCGQMIDPDSIGDHKNVCHQQGDEAGLETELCESCGMTFTSKELLESHIEKVHGNDHDDTILPELCESCGEMFQSVPDLEQHIMVQHSNIENPPVDKVSNLDQNERRRSKHNRKSYERKSRGQTQVLRSVFKWCKTLSASGYETLGRALGLSKRAVKLWFQNSRHASKLNAIGEEEIDDAPKHCDLCSMTFEQGSDISDHLLNSPHLGNLLKECGVKNSPLKTEDKETFVSKDGKREDDKGLKSGNSRKDQPSSEEKSNSNTCRKPLSRSGFNSGKNLFNCTRCAKSFPSKRCLLQHTLRVHTGKVHDCKNCEKQFRRKDHLRRHQQRNCAK